jgi:hypothetical protein
MSSTLKTLFATAILSTVACSAAIDAPPRDDAPDAAAPAPSAAPRESLSAADGGGAIEATSTPKADGPAPRTARPMVGVGVHHLSEGVRPAFPSGGLRVFNIYWDNNWDAHHTAEFSIANIDAATRSLLSTGYFQGLHQYGVPGLVWAGSTNTNRAFLPCAAAPGPSVDGLSLMEFLECEESSVTSGVAKAGGVPLPQCVGCDLVPGGCIANLGCYATPNPTGDVIYNVILPKGTLENDFGNVSCAAGSWDAYHSQIPSERLGGLFSPVVGTEGRPLYFTVLPAECVGSVAQLIGNMAHELVEAATDPLPLTGWIDTAAADPNLGRADVLHAPDLLKEGEAGDLCEGQPEVSLVAGGEPIAVPPYWSNADGQCVYPGLAPSLPACGAGQVRCAAGTSTCIDLSSDDANCGACGNVCGSGTSCWAGQCRAPRAWLWSGSPTACGPASPYYSYNSTGASNTVCNTSTGRYSVSFPGLATLGGNVQVSAYGGQAARCKVEYWTPSGTGTTVSVVCNDATGAPANALFTVTFDDRTDVDSAHRNIGAYAWVDAAHASSTPSSTYQWNSNGSPLTVAYGGAGQYTVDLTGQNTGPDGGGGSVLVTAYGGGSTYCKVGGWWESGNDRFVAVRCFDNAGNLTDSQFTLAYARPLQPRDLQGGFAWTSAPASPSYTPATYYQWNARAVTDTAGRYSVGSTFLDFPSLPATGSGGCGSLSSTAVVTGYGYGAEYCTVGGWGNDGAGGSRVAARCFAPGGAPVDAPYSEVFQNDDCPGTGG